jgi:hypothetical protein
MPKRTGFTSRAGSTGTSGRKRATKRRLSTSGRRLIKIPTMRSLTPGWPIATAFSAVRVFGCRRTFFRWRKTPPRKLFRLTRLSEAHTLLAYVKLYYDWEWAEAEREYQKAIELNPELCNAASRLRVPLISSGRTEEAFSEIKS